MFRKSITKPNTTPKKSLNFKFGGLGRKKKNKNDRSPDRPVTPDSDYEDSHDVPVDDDSEHVEVYVDTEDEETGQNPDIRDTPNTSDVGDSSPIAAKLQEPTQEQVQEPPPKPVMPSPKAAPKSVLTDEERKARARKAVEQRKAERRRKNRKRQEAQGKIMPPETPLVAQEEKEKVTPTEDLYDKDAVRERLKRAIEEEERLYKEQEKQRVIEEERLQKEKELRERQEEEDELRRMEEALEREAEDAKNEAKLAAQLGPNLDKLQKEEFDMMKPRKEPEAMKEEFEKEITAELTESVKEMDTAKYEVAVESVDSRELQREEEEGRLNFERAEEERKHDLEQKLKADEIANEEAHLHFTQAEEDTEREAEENTKDDGLVKEEAESPNLANLIDQFITPDEIVNSEDDAPHITQDEKGNQGDEAPHVTQDEKVNQEDEAPHVTLDEKVNSEDDAPYVTPDEKVNQEDEAPHVTQDEKVNSEDDAPLVIPDEKVDPDEDEIPHVGDVSHDTSVEDDFDAFLDDVFNAPSPPKKIKDVIPETKTKSASPPIDKPADLDKPAIRPPNPVGKPSNRPSNRPGKSTVRPPNLVVDKPSNRPSNRPGKPVQPLPNRVRKPAVRSPNRIPEVSGKKLPRSPRRNDVKIENMPSVEGKKSGRKMPSSQRLNPVYTSYFGLNSESRSMGTCGTCGSECTISSIPKPPTFFGRPVDMPSCSNVYIPNLHPLGPCQMCLFRLSESEMAEFEKNGRHLRVALTTGGCLDCKIFPSLPGQDPVRLCKQCFFDTHSISRKEDKAFSGIGVLGGIQKERSKYAGRRGRYKGGRY